MSKTSDKLAAGVRRIKTGKPVQRESDPHSGATAPAQERAGFALPSPTEGPHPARVWPD